VKEAQPLTNGCSSRVWFKITTTTTAQGTIKTADCTVVLNVVRRRTERVAGVTMAVREMSLDSGE
jgi:hypothetical protein